MGEAYDPALRAWGGELRARHLRRRRLRNRAALVAGGCLCVAATIVAPPAPRLVWNVSASTQVGFYAISPGERAARGALLLVRPPAAGRRLAAERGYLPARVPMLKRAEGLSGDTVCALGDRIFVNARLLAVRRSADGQGRPLPLWQGCLRLGPGSVFLLNPSAADSFDGRYFGPSKIYAIIGTARRLWPR